MACIFKQILFIEKLIEIDQGGETGSKNRGSPVNDYVVYC